MKQLPLKKTPSSFALSYKLLAMIFLLLLCSTPLSPLFLPYLGALALRLGRENNNDRLKILHDIPIQIANEFEANTLIAQINLPDESINFMNTDAFNKLPLTVKPSKTTLKQTNKVVVTCNPTSLCLNPSIHQLTTHIYQALPYALNNQLLLNLMRKKTFEIIITHVAQLGCHGAFIPPGKGSSKAIVVIAPNHSGSIEEIRKALANELHHVAMWHEYKRREGNSKNQRNVNIPMLAPIYGEDGQANKKLITQLDMALKAGFKRLKALKALQKKYYRTKPAGELPQTLSQLYHALKNYVPQIYVETMQQTIAEILLEKASVKMQDGRYRFKSTESSITKYIHSISLFNTITPNLANIYYTYMKANTPKHRAIAFFKDFSMLKKEMGDKGSYGRNTKIKNLAEWSSSIELYPEPIKKLLFEEWCAYFSAYTQTEDYCSLSP